MAGSLQLVEPDGDPPCAICGEPAAGPCAHCRAMVCGDCCVLTEGSVRTWAICTRCDRKRGKSLLGGWALVAAWVLVPVVGLVLFGLVVELFRR
jgi:hypothetical protein